MLVLERGVKRLCALRRDVAGCRAEERRCYISLLKSRSARHSFESFGDYRRLGSESFQPVDVRFAAKPSNLALRELPRRLLDAADGFFEADFSVDMVR